MAWFLATRLKEAKWSCRGVWGRSFEKAADLASAAGGKAFNTLSELPDDVDACLLAVSDDQIALLAHELTLKGAFLIHFGGAVPLEVLPGEQKAVVWFIYSILKDNLPQHRALPAVVEAQGEKARQVAMALAHAVSDIVQEVASEQRRWLHLGAVFANNFTNHLMTVCEELCRKNQLSFDLLKPILQQTFSRVRNHSPFELQTGPARRGDEQTIQSHLNLLRSEPELQELYRLLTKMIISKHGL